MEDGFPNPNHNSKGGIWIVNADSPDLWREWLFTSSMMVCGGFWQFQFAECSVTLLNNNIQSPTTRTYSCQQQSSLAIWHCWVTTLRGPFRLSFLGTRHVGNVNHKFSDDTYVGWWRTDRTDLTYIDLRRCLLFIIFKRCSPSPVLASPVIFSFELWISCCSCRVLRFLSFANLGRTPPRVGQIFFLVMLFDCKMWMEKLCSWSQEGFMS